MGKGASGATGGIAFGMSWGHPKRGRLLKAAVALLAPILLLAAPASASLPAGGNRVSVIVREGPGAGNIPEQAVRWMGGHVGRHIGIIDGFEATVPRGGVRILRSIPHVYSVTPNARIRLTHAIDGFDAGQDDGSMYTIVEAITMAGDYWQDGYTGAGVDVALIDSGVVPVDGLTVPGKVINGADLSFESQAENLRYLDTYATAPTWPASSRAETTWWRPPW